MYHYSNNYRIAWVGKDLKEHPPYLGNLFQCLTILRGKNFLLTSKLNLPSFSLKLFPYPIITNPHKESLPIFPVGIPEVLQKLL